MEPEHLRRYSPLCVFLANWLVGVGTGVVWDQKMMNEGINWGTDKKGHHFANDIIFEFIFLNENGYLLIQISQKSVLKDPNDEHCFRYWLCA